MTSNNKRKKSIAYFTFKFQPTQRSSNKKSAMFEAWAISLQFENRTGAQRVAAFADFASRALDSEVATN